MIISITHPPRQLRTWEYYHQNRTIKIDFMRHQWQVLECFWKSDQKSTLITGFWTRNKCSTSGESKPVHIGDLCMGIISCLHHPSKSLIGAPVFFIKKKEGSLHLVQDYWKLNEIMIKNSYPLPLVSDVLTRLHDAEWFTTLDLHWGFNNVHLKEGDEWKAAF